MSAVLALQCRPARLADAPAYRRYVTECAEDGQPLYQVAQFDPDGWLQSLLDHAEGRNLPSGYLPTTTYFALDGEEIIATLRLRHGDNEATRQWLGHIGYETRPSRRGEGAATVLLRWVQQQVLAAPVLISSAKIIWLPARSLRPPGACCWGGASIRGIATGWRCIS